MNFETGDFIKSESDWTVNMFCAICVQTLQKDASKSITTLLDNSVKAYELLESLSMFKFMVNGPKQVCASCFDRILNAYELQKMCNQAQKQFEQYLNYYENLHSQCEDTIHEFVKIQDNTDKIEEIESKFQIDLDERNIEVSNNTETTCAEINISDSNNCDGIVVKKQNIVIPERPRKPKKPKPIYQCNICLKTFAGNFSLDVHTRRFHTGEKPFMCHICGVSFVDKSVLKSHQFVHQTIRPIQCKLCPKTFKHKFQLAQHVKTHSEERNFKCFQCDHRSKTKKCLKEHEQIHTGQRPFKCEVCLKSFIKSDKLKLHMRVHTGEKPYACSYCNSRFTQKYYWTVHEAKHIEKQKKS